MTQKNRELSQFGSFLEVNNTNQNIGIATTGTPYIGIGTINPQYKLHLVGDTNIDGAIYLNGTPLVDAALQPWTPDGSNIYRENGSVGIGTSVYPSTFSVSGDATFSDEVTASQFISTVTTGTAPLTVTSQTEVTNLNASFLRGKTPPSGSIVGTSDIQTLTNKTLNLSGNTLTGTIAQFNNALSDDDFVTLSGIQTLTNKTLTTPIISGIRPSNGQLQNIPSGSGTLVSSNSVGIITTGMIANGTITSIDISSGAGITNGQLANSTISGISLGNNLNDLTAGSYITYNSGTTYNGSTSRTIGVAGTTLNTANTLVARDASGDFSAGSIDALSFDATSDDAYRISGTTIIDSNRNVNNIGILTATSLSDSEGDIRKVPQNSKTSSYTLIASDSGKHINITSGGIIVPADIFSPGDAITIFNNSSSNQTITQDTNVTLRLAGSSLTGNRTLSQYGICTILNITGGSTPTFVISGAGLS